MRELVQKSVNLIPFGIRDSIRKIPLVSGLQRTFFKAFLSGQSFDYKINAGPATGLVYPITLPADKNIWTGTYELEFSTELASHVKPGSICYDIGGFRGYFGGLMARRGAKSVYFFEPLPENIEQIRRVIDRNTDLDLNLLELAVSSAPGAAVFQIMPEQSMGKLATSTFDSGEDALRELPVTLESLDHFVLEGGNPPPDLIKIDVEGAEVDVLKGARNVMAKHHPILLIEVHSLELGQECHTLLDAAGYQHNPLEAVDPATGEPPPVHHLICTPAEP